MADLKEKAEKQMSEIIEKVHIDSPDFDPFVFLTTLHKTTQSEQFK